MHLLEFVLKVVIKSNLNYLVYYYLIPCPFRLKRIQYSNFVQEPYRPGSDAGLGIRNSSMFFRTVV